MCGRFGVNEREGFQVMKSAFTTNIITSNKLRDNVSLTLTDTISALKKIEEEIYFDHKTWGIKFKKDGPLIFNSRIETIKEKPFWRRLFDKNRILVPMYSFHEKAHITFENNQLFFTPGLYFEKDNDFFATIITCEPNDFMQDVLQDKKGRKRMPVILSLDQAELYLNDSAENNIEKCIPYSGHGKMINLDGQKGTQLGFL